MIKINALFIAVVFFCQASGQTVFFTSKNHFEKSNTDFYASVRIYENLILFNANDYNLYVYDREGTQLKWTKHIRWKSDRAPFVINKEVWCQVGENEMKRFDAETGNELAPLPLYTVETQPVIKEHMAYFTGIYDGGCIIGYDLQADSIKWKKFIAHGTWEKPYYFKDKMLVNVEGDRWLALDYNGEIKIKQCAAQEHEFLAELSCVQNFSFLTHDEKEVSGKLADRLIDNSYDYKTDVYLAPNHTLILSSEHLYIIGDKLKMKKEVDISSLDDSMNVNQYLFFKILSASDQTMTFMHSNHLFEYSINSAELLNNIDLSAYEPHTAILEKNRLWLISGKDGRLYGLDITMLKNQVVNFPTSSP